MGLYLNVEDEGMVLTPVSRLLLQILDSRPLVVLFIFSEWRRIFLNAGNSWALAA